MRSPSSRCHLRSERGSRQYIQPDVYCIRQQIHSTSSSLCTVQSKVTVQMEDSVEVSATEAAVVTCTFSFSEEPPSVNVQWFASKDDRKRIYSSSSSMSVADEAPDFAGRLNISSNYEGTSFTHGNSILTLRDVSVKDEREFICQVDGISAGSTEGRTQLRVFESPESPDIIGADTGIIADKDIPSKIATCQTRNGYPVPNITWYRDVNPLQKSNEVYIVNREIQESSGLYTVESELHYTVTKKDKDVLFHCEVSFLIPWGTKMVESNHISLDVYYPSTKIDMWILRPTGLVKEGDTVEIKCRGDGNPPPLFSFLKKGSEVELEQDVETLLLRNVTRADSGLYLCQSIDLAGVDPYDDVLEGTIQLQVHYLDDAVVKTQNTEPMKVGDSREVTCNALSSLITHTEWFKDGKKIDAGNVLNLQNVSYEAMGEYTCQVTLPSLPSLHREAVILIMVQGPPVITPREDSTLDARIGHFLNLTCEAVGFPKPNITWNVSGTQMMGRSSDVEGRARSIVNIEVTSDLTAFCIATNEQGTARKLYRVKAGKSSTPPSDNNGTKEKKVQKESGVIIAVIIICILLLAILGSVLYFLYKKGKISCGHSGKKEITKEKGKKDDIVMEMKTDKTEETVLLQGVNGDKKSLDDQCDEYLDVEN